MEIILASTSPYRREQLQRIVSDFESLPPGIDEDSFKDSIIDPHQLAQKLSYEKAKAILDKRPNAFVIGGDQVLSIEGEILGKPGTEQKAIQQLQRLSGKTHQLITATTYMSANFCETITIVAKMKMRSLKSDQIESYIKKESPLGCCGSYMLEHSGIALFESIECEDYTAIIGLPLMSSASVLMKNGLSIF
ncbi:Maf family protein [Halobacteriovorax marinus]|uniref:Maf family protein n=1 Tax=Halobacteriovorax marinus TaxID=97084 RepID=UPI003A8DFD99